MKLEEIKKQIGSIVDKDVPLISNLSNIASLLFKMDDINWAGFYLVDGEKLILGPFQGDPACLIIPKGKGVCGTAFATKKSVVVSNVHEFPGHIACSSLSKSEIVVPVIKDDKVNLVIDIDSPKYDRFHDDDLKVLKEIATIIEQII